MRHIWKCHDKFSASALSQYVAMITRHALQDRREKPQERIMFAFAVIDVPASDESVNA